MKKILFYINTLEHGGAERVMANLANQFSAHGYSAVFAVSYPGENEYPLSDQVKRIPLLEDRIDDRLKRNVKTIRALRKLLKQEKPDILLAFMGEPNIRAIIASVGLRNIKTVVSVRNDPAREYPNKVMRIAANFLFRFADGIVFQTKDAQNWFPAYISRKSEIILNQVADVFFDTKHSECCKNVISVGRLDKQKNHELLIRAFNEIKNETDDNLIIYGEGPLRTNLESLIKELSLSERVFLPGIVSDVADRLKDAKLFVLSSDYEGMPNALMEAMAVGVPSISTDCPCGGPKTLIEDNRNGFLFPIRSQESLVNKMREVLVLNREQYTLISKQSKDSAERFRGNVVFRCWEEFLMHVMRK